MSFQLVHLYARGCSTHFGHVSAGWASVPTAGNRHHKAPSLEGMRGGMLGYLPAWNETGTTAPGRPLSGAVQYSVHHLGPRRDDRAQLVAVDQLCGGGAVVPGQSRNLLDGHPVG